MGKGISIRHNGANILIIGEAGREHALAAAFEKSSNVAVVYVAPGNDGLLHVSDKIQCIPIESSNISELVRFAIKNQVDATFVGPEKPIAMGIVDAFRAKNLPIVGPTQAAARLESSKVFAKGIMEEAGIETADYVVFHPGQLSAAKAFLETQTFPLVIKESGLADGKGVTICHSAEEAYVVSRSCLRDKQVTIVMEEYLEGPEYSHFSLVNENQIISLGLARDYKRAFDLDRGPNTGGMGAVSPVTTHDEILNQQIVTEVVQPLVTVMIDRGIPFTGILYSGLMNTAQGMKVIEFNVRLGDPEAQVLLPRIENDWMTILHHHFEKKPLSIQLSSLQSIGVTVASIGYPETEDGSAPISTESVPSPLKLFYGAVREERNRLYAAGGRVFLAQVLSDSIEQGRKDLYEWLSSVDQTKFFFRLDIGKDCE